jgi:tetratricopeptide (TPR) repeat protein
MKTLSLSKRFRLFFLTLVTCLGASYPAVWAGDPFRSQNPHNIGDNTEAAFIAIFRDGNYKTAQSYLDQAFQTEPTEPLAYAMQASLAYDAANYESMKVYADKTLKTAEILKGQDPLRGNLYLAVGHFLEGGYLLKQGSYLEAVGKAGQVFDYLDLAAKTNPNDPELNLLRGYLDLFLSKYTPFSQSDQVISRFEKYASPDYLKNRALSTTYRDLKQYDKAMNYLNQAIAETPNNPELQYLKGQLLRLEGRNDKDLSKLQQAQTYYAQALQKQDQLSRSVTVQLNHENNAVIDEIQKLQNNPNLKDF